MKFKLDENLPAAELVGALQRLGHDADLIGFDLRGRLTVVEPTRIRMRDEPG